jgi:hypothetical protein
MSSTSPCEAKRHKQKPDDAKQSEQPVKTILNIPNMDMVRINFIPDRIKYILYEKIKTKAIENHGIIFGGFVRDMIISDHYKSIYNNRNNRTPHNINQFWNRFYQTETAARVIVAKDMDICMYHEEDVNAFIVALGELFNEEVGFGNVSSSDFTTTNENTTLYHKVAIKMHKKIIYKVIVGNIPYVHNGVELTFEFDIIVPANNNIQPPFNNTDMLSNVFILNKQGVMMSNHTGTIIDNMSVLNRQKMSLKIMSDVVEFKTQFCMRCSSDNHNNENNLGCGNFEYNIRVYERIQKMLFREFQWNITNLPFFLENYKAIKNKNIEETAADGTSTETHPTFVKETCCICLECLNSNEKVVKISTNTKKVYTTLHAHCIFKYFNTQLEAAKKDWLDDTEQFEFKCPMRSVVNFKKCSDNIDRIINDKMKA